ncbi:MAG: hypothetical protein Q8R37_04770 [Nanoarchaeota archaeon]|nr:hypothetical protein [Nanoarchaeota archaeon]
MDKIHRKETMSVNTLHSTNIKLCVYLIIIVLLFSSSISAQEHQGFNDGVDDAITDPAADFVSNPTADGLLSINNPTVDQFLTLSVDQQAVYLEQRYNQEFADQYYHDAAHVGINQLVDELYFEKPDNIGKNPAADDAFFTGSYSLESQKTARENIKKILLYTSPNSVSRYFSTKYNAPYAIDLIAENFLFNLEQGTITNGAATITLSAFSGDATIERIGTVEKGIIIMRGTQEVQLTGDSTVALTSYVRDEVTGGSILVVQKENHLFTVSGSNSLRFISIQDSLQVVGDFSGTASIAGEDISFVTDEGIIFGNDGSWQTENAEINTDIVYVRGRSERRKSGDKFDYHLQDIGKTNLAAARPQRSVFVDKIGGIAATSQGREVVVHYDDVNLLSRYSPRELKTEQVRARAEQALHQQESTATIRADVWIKNDGVSTFVYARGPVLVEHYAVDAGIVFDAVLSKPRFQGKTASAVFDYVTDGSRGVFTLQGEGIYSDAQFAAEGLQEKSVIEKKSVYGFEKNDIIEVRCDGCSENQKVAHIYKNVVVKKLPSDQSSYDDAEESFSVEKTRFGLDFTVVNGQIQGSFNVDELQDIADGAGNGELVFDKGLFVRSSDGMNYFGISDQGVGRYELLQENAQGKLTINAVGIDFSFAVVNADRFVVTSPEEKTAVDQILSILETKNYGALRQLTSLDVADPALREFIQRHFDIDAAQLDSVAYTEKIVARMQAEEEASRLALQLQQQYDVEFDSLGNCLRNCAVLEQAFAGNELLARSLFDLKREAVQSQIHNLEAKKEAALQQGKSTKEFDKKLDFLQDRFTVFNDGYKAIESKIAYDQAGRFVEKAATNSFTEEERAVLADAVAVGGQRRIIAQSLSDVKQKLDYLKKKSGRETEQSFDQQLALSQQKRELNQRLKKLQDQLYAMDTELEVVRHTAGEITDNDAAFLSLLLYEGGDLKKSLALAQDVRQRNGDAGNYLIALACANAGDIACARNAREGITDQKLESTADKAIHRSEINYARQRYNQAQDRYADAKGAARQFEIEREERSLPSALYFWDDQDRENEQGAVRSAAAVRDAHYASLLLQEHGGFSLEELEQMSEEQARSNLRGVLEEIKGQPVSELTTKVGSWVDYKETTLTPAVQTFQGHDLSDQEKFNLAVREAEAIVAVNHLDEAAAEDFYYDILDQFDGTTADLSRAQQALQRINDDKILGFSGQERGRFASEAIDVTIAADFAGNAVLYGTKAVIYSGKALKAVKFVRTVETVQDVLFAERQLLLPGSADAQFHRLIKNQAALALKAEQYGARSGAELFEQVLQNEGEQGLRELNKLDFDPDSAFFNELSATQIDDLQQAGLVLDRADTLVLDVESGTKPLLRGTAEDYTNALSSEATTDVFTAADDLIIADGKFYPESVTARLPSPAVEQGVITVPQRSPLPNDLAVARSVRRDIVRADDTLLLPRVTNDANLEGVLNDPQFVRDDSFLEQPRLSEIAVQIDDTVPLSALRRVEAVPAGTGEVAKEVEIISVHPGRNSPQYRAPSLEEIINGDLAPETVLYLEDNGLEFIEKKALSDPTLVFLDENIFTTLSISRDDIFAKEIPDFIKDRLREFHPIQYQIIDDLDLWQVKPFLGKDNVYYFVKVGHTDALVGEDVILIDTVRRHKAAEIIMRRELSFGPAVPETMVLDLGDGIQLVASPQLKGYTSLSKSRAAEKFKFLVDTNVVPIEEIPALAEQFDEIAVFNVWANAGDVELGLAQIDGRWQVTSIDNELTFNNFDLPEQHYDLANKVLLDNGFSPETAVKQIPGNDKIFSVIRREEFYRGSVFDEELFQLRFSNLIDQFNELADSPRLYSYLQESGYTFHEAELIINQLQNQNLETRLRQLIEADGRGILTSKGDIVDAQGFIVEHGGRLPGYASRETGELINRNLEIPPPVSDEQSVSLSKIIEDANIEQSTLIERGIVPLPDVKLSPCPLVGGAIVGRAVQSPCLPSLSLDEIVMELPPTELPPPRVVSKVKGYENTVSNLYDSITPQNIDEIFQLKLESLGSDVYGGKAIAYIHDDGSVIVVFLTETEKTHHRHALGTIIGGERGDLVYDGQYQNYLIADIPNRAFGFEFQFDKVKRKIIGIEASSQISNVQKAKGATGWTLQEDVVSFVEQEMLEKIDLDLIDDSLVVKPFDKWVDKSRLPIDYND